MASDKSVCDQCGKEYEVGLPEENDGFCSDACGVKYDAQVAGDPDVDKGP